MKILITGGNGQVGWELARAIMPLGEVSVMTRDQLDLNDTNQIRTVIAQVSPDVIINPAAYTAVDKAEQEQDLAHRINADAPAVMAEELKKSGGLLIHYSTDYVFDGSMDRPYVESDPTCPVNSYGASKLAGEVAIQQSGVDHLILRTSWVYTSRAHNFMKSMLKLGSERQLLKIVDDQVGAPTSARLIAETTAHILKQSLVERKQQQFKSDLYHLTAANYTSWYGFAKAIIEQARLRDDLKVVTQKIEPIPTTEYPLPAQRPLNSRLNVSKLEQKFDLKMPSWQQTLEMCLQEV